MILYLWAIAHVHLPTLFFIFSDRQTKIYEQGLRYDCAKVYFSFIVLLQMLPEIGEWLHQNILFIYCVLQVLPEIGELTTKTWWNAICGMIGNDLVIASFSSGKLILNMLKWLFQKFIISTPLILCHLLNHLGECPCEVESSIPWLGSKFLSLSVFCFYVLMLSSIIIQWHQIYIYLASFVFSSKKLSCEPIWFLG